MTYKGYDIISVRQPTGFAIEIHNNHIFIILKRIFSNLQESITAGEEVVNILTSKPNK